MWNAALSKAIWSVLCLHVYVCVCLFVCLCTLLFRFTHRGLSTEAKTTSQAGKAGPENPLGYFSTPSSVSVWFHLCAVVTLQETRRLNTTANYFLPCQNLLVGREITLSVNVCVFSMSHKILLAPCLLFVRGVFCLDVITASLSSLFPCKHRRRCGLFQRDVWTEDHCRGRPAKEKDVTDCSNAQFSWRTCTPRKHRKTQKHKY